MKKRIVSIELLRILAMMMVVMLHYLSKGGLLTSLTEEFSGGAYIAWLLEAFSIVAVNVYMLISGYFLVESGFKFGRLAELVCQVLFYSLLIPPILMAAGILDQPLSGEEVNATAEKSRETFSQLLLRCLEKM